jgi:glycosyltransferase involved in cell wall biosynthesis
VKISIVTVTYNSISTIENCLSSIIKQTFKDIDYVVVDGSSTDGTLDLLKRNSKYISTLVSQPDNGIYDAMNKGISLAKGDIIGFLNSDDLYVNNKIIDRVAKVFSEDPLIESCYADLIYVDQKNTSKIIRYWQSNKFKSGAFLKGWSPPHPTFFVRSSIYKRYGSFNLNYKFASDVELMMRLIEVNKIRVKYIPEIWVKMRTGGVSNKSLKNILIQNKEVLHALREHKLPVNLIIFFINKIILRFKQFLKKPNYL